mgnify:CR=1 FL=1
MENIRAVEVYFEDENIKIGWKPQAYIQLVKAYVTIAGAPVATTPEKAIKWAMDNGW